MRCVGNLHELRAVNGFSSTDSGERRAKPAEFEATLFATTSVVRFSTIVVGLGGIEVGGAGDDAIVGPSELRNRRLRMPTEIATPRL